MPIQQETNRHQSQCHYRPETSCEIKTQLFDRNEVAREGENADHCLNSGEPNRPISLASQCEPYDISEKGQIDQ